MRAIERKYKEAILVVLLRIAEEYGESMILSDVIREMETELTYRK